jgi:hypothetical protein
MPGISGLPQNHTYVKNIIDKRGEMIYCYNLDDM